MQLYGFPADKSLKVKWINGTFIGLTADGRLAKTVLAFMVQFVADKCKVVCFTPVNKLNAASLLHLFDCLLDAINDFFSSCGCFCRPSRLQ